MPFSGNPSADCRRAVTVRAFQSNAEVLARYAAVCQSMGIVPIVEPEVLIDGNHTIERAAEVSEDVLLEVFKVIVALQILLG